MLILFYHTKTSTQVSRVLVFSPECPISFHLAFSVRIRAIGSRSYLELNRNSKMLGGAIWGVQVESLVLLALDVKSVKGTKLYCSAVSPDIFCEYPSER